MKRTRNHYLGHSFVFLIAARLGVDTPEANLNFFNRGKSGNTVSDLRKRWQADAIDMKPDVLTILVGTNDVGRGVTPEKFEEDYRFILEESLKANPDLKIVLFDPFVLKCGRLKDDAAWKTRRRETDKMGEVVARLAQEFRTVHIKTQEIFDKAAEQVSPEHWIWDGIHPLPQGHELIARKWIESMGVNR